ncbi:unnamed protein product [Closterium sp. Naga37s-1]|nr:unnamed protein product [Closterium sp. Naga37s-1]
MKCSVCIAHAGVGTNFGAKGEGATDVQTQAMRRHQRTRKHHRALRRQRTAEAALKANRRIDDNPKVKDVEKERLIARFETTLFIAKSDAPIEMYVDLVDLTVVHSIIYIEQGYLNCGQQFGGGTSELLSAFLARHASPDCREVTVEGVDKEGQPRVHTFQLHEEAVKGYTTSSGDMQGCYTCCRSFARELVYNLVLCLGDLPRLNGAKLFMPRSWPGCVEARDAECKEDLHGLVHLFQAKNRDTILPGVQKRAARAELRTFLPWEKVVDIWRSSRKRRPSKRKEQPAPEKERAKAKFVKGSGRRVLQVEKEEEELDDEGMHGSAGNDSESDDTGSSGDDASVSDDDMT